MGRGLPVRDLTRAATRVHGRRRALARRGRPQAAGDRHEPPLRTRRRRRCAGTISLETVVIALGLFALATVIVGLLTAWATGKLGGLT